VGRETARGKLDSVHASTWETSSALPPTGAAAP
jgi:hypothetical protein